MARESAAYGVSSSSSESSAGAAPKSSKPMVRAVGESVGVEDEEFDEKEMSENVELLLTERCNEARPTGFRDNAANWSIVEGICRFIQTGSAFRRQGFTGSGS